MHPAPMWPIHNYYVCPSCQRRWPVPWLKNEMDARQSATEESHPVPSFRPAERSL